MEEKKQPPSREEIDVTLEALGLRRFSTEEKSVLTSLGAEEISFVESRFFLWNETTVGNLKCRNKMLFQAYSKNVSVAQWVFVYRTKNIPEDLCSYSSGFHNFPTLKDALDWLGFRVEAQN